MQRELSVNLRRFNTDFGFEPYRDLGIDWSYLAIGLNIQGKEFPGLYHIDAYLGRIFPIHNIKYLAGKVSISSSKEAISFARLITSPILANRMDDFIGYEVMLIKNFKPDDWPGLDQPIRNVQSGYCGLISEEDAAKIGFVSVKCNQGNTFHIDRFVLQRDKNGLIKNIESNCFYCLRRFRETVIISW